VLKAVAQWLLSVFIKNFRIDKSYGTFIERKITQKEVQLVTRPHILILFGKIF